MDEESVPLSSSEAHLDLLLAEELSVNREFMRRFLSQLGDVAARADLGGDDLTATVELNVWDESVGAAGENDIVVRVQAGDVALGVLVEDKVWATFQPAQCCRYRARADARQEVTVLVAPRSRLTDEHHRECFDAVLAIEELADWLDEQAEPEEPLLRRRLRWRAAMLRGLCSRSSREPKPDHGPTVAFTRFCQDWLAEREPLAVPDAGSLRTAGNGWLWFSTPKGLVYKAIHSRVDFYVNEHHFAGTADDLAAAVASGWGPKGFVAATDTKGNPVLRFEDSAIYAISSNGVPDDTAGVERALEAVVTVVRWLADRGGDLALETEAAPD